MRDANKLEREKQRDIVRKMYRCERYSEKRFSISQRVPRAREGELSSGKMGRDS